MGYAIMTLLKDERWHLDLHVCRTLQETKCLGAKVTASIYLATKTNKMDFVNPTVSVASNVENNMPIHMKTHHNVLKKFKTKPIASPQNDIE
jgi:hypothetical protein